MNGGPRDDARRMLPGSAGAAILRELALGERSVTDIIDATGLSQSNVSNHLSRLRERGLVASRRVGRQMLYRLESATLAQFLLIQGSGEELGSKHPTSKALAEQFLEAVLSLKEEEAVHAADTALASGMDWRRLYLDIFAPALERVGDLWAAGKLPVAAEHLITGMILRLLHRLSLALPSTLSPGAPTALVGCVEGELHSVGGRMFSDFLLAAGWRVWFLNGYLPADELMEAVNRHLPKAIVLCITAEHHAEALNRAVARLTRWRGEQPLPLLVVGGRYFEQHPSPAGVDIAGAEIEPVIEAMMERLSALQQL